MVLKGQMERPVNQSGQNSSSEI